MAAVPTTAINHFPALPQEVLPQILDLLPRADAVQAARVCRDFKLIVDRQANQCKTIRVDHPSFDADKLRAMLESGVIQKLTVQADNADPKPALMALFKAMATDGVVAPELNEITMSKPYFQITSHADRTVLPSIFPHMTLQHEMKYQPAVLRIDQLNLDSSTDYGMTSLTFINPNDPAEMQAFFGETGVYTQTFILKRSNSPDVTITLTEASSLTTLCADIDAIVGISASVQNNALVINASDIRSHFELLDDVGDVVTQLFGHPTIQQHGFDLLRSVSLTSIMAFAGTPTTPDNSYQTINLYFKHTRLGEWRMCVYTQEADAVTNGNQLLTEGVLKFGRHGQLIDLSPELNHFDILWNKAKTGHDPISVHLDLGLEAATGESFAYPHTPSVVFSLDVLGNLQQHGNIAQTAGPFHLQSVTLQTNAAPT